MKASLMKRLFKTISNGDLEDLNKIANLIIDDEQKKGHTRLVTELGNILKKHQGDTEENLFSKYFEYQNKTGSLTTLPKSKRNDIPLASRVPMEHLEYEMVLPPEVEKRFLRIEREYAARERLALYGLHPRRKILLHGPPGCGKTIGAQRLSWNTGLPFVKVSFDAMVSSYLGETSSNLRAIFDTASQSPCLLFIDECDSLAKSRTSGQEVGEIKRVVNSFLQLLDEYDAPGLLVAATNLNDQLDPAVWRRFDDVFELPKPGPEEIKRLIIMALSSIRSTKFNWDEIISEAKGFSAAQIVRASKDAAKRTVLDGYELVNQEILLDAIHELKGGIVIG